MRKPIVLLLLLALLLAGCHGELPAETTQPSETTVPTEPPAVGIYVPDSDVEERSFGALRTYLPENTRLVGLTFLGERLLTVSEGEAGMILSLYEGQTLVPVGELTVSGSFSLDGAAVHITGSTISWYDEHTREVVLVGEDLLEHERVLLPEDAVGEPAVASDFSAVYYSTGSQIRAMDIQTGVVRLLREMADQQVTMQALCAGNSLLVCQVTDGEDRYTAFLSAETGETLHTDDGILELHAGEKSYFAQRRSASLTEQVFGSWDGEARMLAPAEKEYTCCYVPQTNGALTASAVAQRGLSLSLYDLNSGRRTASVLLPDGESIVAAAADATGENLWLIAKDSRGYTCIYRWELRCSEIRNPTEYTTVWYTRENPDTEGLARLRAKADALEQTYGVDILLLQEELVMSQNYTMTAEYQIRALEMGLAALETALGRFPDGFFKTLAQVTSDGVLHISLVQSINSRGEASGPAGLRYWVEQQEYIAIYIYGGMEQGLYHEICHALDSFLLANSSVLDGWEDLNPEGFVYDQNFDAYLQREESPYLTGDTRAFIDSYSMTYPKEDRARFFEYAMTPDHGEYFASETMQAKLRLLCKAIRDAYGWKEEPTVFLWEQYLKKPMVRS